MEKTIPRVTVSIVTYNSQYIFKTLDSFCKEILPNFPVELLIHDNGSDGAYLARLQTYRSEQIKIIAAGENLGFGHGHNANLVLTETDYFLICNPDIIINEKAFAKMYRFLEESSVSEKIGMLTPMITGPNGDIQYLVRERLDVFDYFLRFIPFGFVKRLFKGRLDRYECRNLTNDRQKIKYGSGAFMFTRTQVLKEIGGFDEQFFMYFEDNDLCDRIRAAGFEIWLIPDAKVTHFYGMASHRSSTGFKIFMKSMYKYFHKWGWQFF